MSRVFDHEKQEVDRAALAFVDWLEPVLQDIPKSLSVVDQLDRASTSISLFDPSRLTIRNPGPESIPRQNEPLSRAQVPSPVSILPPRYPPHRPLMHPYRQLVADVARHRTKGRALPLGGFAPSPRVPIAPDAPRVLIFSPHPDDECIIGGLALRLLRESKWRVVNVAVTQGSRKDRQEGRLAELRKACEFLQFDLVTTVPGGLEKINPKTRVGDPTHWNQAVSVIARILAEQKPRAILFPHELDWNSSHIGTHHLVVDALKTLPPGFECHTVETEFWGAMANPNLMVENAADDVADLIAACSFHVGEVQRNPYHLSQTAWMQDNVRRGGELVGGQGGAAPDYLFATLYRLRRWKQGNLETFYQGGRNLGSDDAPASLFS